MKNWYVIYYYNIDSNCNISQTTHLFLHSVSQEDKLIENLVDSVYKKYVYNPIRITSVIKLDNNGDQSSIFEHKSKKLNDLEKKILNAFEARWLKFKEDTNWGKI